MAAREERPLVQRFGFYDPDLEGAVANMSEEAQLPVAVAFRVQRLEFAVESVKARDRKRNVVPVYEADSVERFIDTLAVGPQLFGLLRAPGMRGGGHQARLEQQLQPSLDDAAIRLGHLEERIVVGRHVERRFELAVAHYMRKAAVCEGFERHQGE